MNCWRKTWLAALAGALMAMGPSACGVGAAAQRAALEQAVTAGWPAAEGLGHHSALADFYAAREYRPLWTGGDGLTDAGLAVLERLHASRALGLEPAEYHVSAIEAHRQNVDASGLARLELLLADGLVKHARDLYGGRLPPRGDPKWAYPPRSLPVGEVLTRLVGAGGWPGDVLAGLAPDSHRYRRLLTARRSVANPPRAPWRRLEVNGVLAPGERHAAVPALRERLASYGFLDPSPPPTDPRLFDDGVSQGLQRFQRFNGLTVDGKLGPRSLQMLNLSPAERLAKVDLNLDRHRWLPRRPEGRHLIVDLPEFSVRAREDEGTQLAMKIVIGKEQYRLQTPQFADELEYLVVNPYWNIPNTIATREILPRLAENPDYFAENAIEAVRGWGENSEAVPVTKVRAVLPVHQDQALPFRLRQRPGPQNALGRIKFMFPNAFNVYLHDTPADQLFREARRTFSHGCIRVEQPRELAMWVLQDTPGWDRKRLDDLIASGERSRVDLAEPLPVLITYFTAQGDGEGRLRLHPDIYDRDARYLDRLLSSSGKSDQASAASSVSGRAMQ